MSEPNQKRPHSSEPDSTTKKRKIAESALVNQDSSVAPANNGPSTLIAFTAINKQAPTSYERTVIATKSDSQQGNILRSSASQNDDRKKSNNEREEGHDKAALVIDNNVSSVQRVLAGLPIAPPTGNASFQKLPMELKFKIFNEAISGPLIHFAQIRKSQEAHGGPWTIKLHVFPKAKDTSGFRFIKDMKEVCEASFQVVTDAQRAMTPIGFRQMNSMFNPQIDIICFDFERKQSARPGFRYFSQELQFLTNENPNFHCIRRQCSNYRHIAIAYKTQFLPSTARACRVFPCFTDSMPEVQNNPFHTYSHQRHCRWTMCPTELAGFLDCFTNLETAYLIFMPKQNRDQSERGQVAEYVEAFRQTSPDHRKALGCKIFYDSKLAYVELNRDIINLYEVNFPLALHTLFPLARQTEDSLRIVGNSRLTAAPILYNLRVQTRVLLSIKILVPAGPKENF